MYGLRNVHVSQTGFTGVAEWRETNKDQTMKCVKFASQCTVRISIMTYEKGEIVAHESNAVAT